MIMSLLVSKKQSVTGELPLADSEGDIGEVRLRKIMLERDLLLICSPDHSGAVNHLARYLDGGLQDNIWSGVAKRKKIVAEVFMWSLQAFHSAQF